MNKQKFEGKINGTMFTDVKEFNKKVSELMQTGENYDISYNWSSENTPEQEKCKCNGGCEGCHKLSQDELGYLVPRYVCGSAVKGTEEYAEKKIEQISKDLDNRFDKFVEAIKCNCARKAIEERLEYAEDTTEEAAQKLENDWNELEKREAELITELNEIQEQKDIMNVEFMLLAEVENYYLDLRDRLECSCNEESDEEIETTITEKQPQMEQNFEIKDALAMLGVDTSKISNEDMNKLQKITNTLAEQLTRYLSGQCF